MKHLDALLLAALALGSPALSAQQAPSGPKLLLASGTPTPPANFTAWVAAAHTERLSATEIWQDHTYRVIQFDRLPTDAQRQALAALGVQLLDYLPQNAYTAALPTNLDRQRLQGFGIRSVVALEPQWKYSGILAQGQTPAHALRGGGKVAVIVGYHATIQPAQVAGLMKAAGYAVGEQLGFSRQITVELPAAQLTTLARLPWVASVEYVAPEAVPDNNVGRTNHRANVLAADYGAGRQYTGAGINVAHGDDRSIGPHIDFTGRVDQTSATAGTATDTHGDHVAGTIMGAGNLDPRYRGMAVGAFNYYYDYPRNINEATQHYTTRSIRITSSSYSNGCNSGYTTLARTMDQMSRTMPLMLHVFSSGNNGAAACSTPYGGGATWGNITGGHKVAKNVITVGNLNLADVLNSSSSRGPATDGRLKPEICAVGTDVMSTQANNTYASFTGTSMACPAVSGVLAQLMQAHKELNGGTEAPGALLKAALMNSAEDLGNPGPDYRFGFGRVDALGAVRVLEQRTYQTNDVGQAQVRTHTITVPTGQRQLRVMLYWHDYEAAASSSRNLVNDLDLTLTAPSGAVTRPLVLDYRPTVASLNAPAVPGRDSINNVEQVVLDLPAAGTYTLNVRGYAVPQGPQPYYLVYSWADDAVEMTYPLGGEGFVPGETETVRWNASPGTESFTLEYTLDNGTTWTTMVSNLAATARHYNWAIPATLAPSGRARVRVRRGSRQDESDANFSLAGVPGNLRITEICNNQHTLAWNAVPGATGYIVFRLGTKYMEPVTTVTGLTATLTLPLTGEEWLAVCAVGADNLKGRRTRAIMRVAAPVQTCPGPPITALAALSSQTCVNVPVQLEDRSQRTPTSWQWSITPSAGVTFVGGTSATSQNPRVQFGQPGVYSVTLSATNSLGNSAATATNLITITPGQALPLSQTFAGTTFPPAGWQVQNPDNDGVTWQLSPSPVTGPNGVAQRVPMMNWYSYSERGRLDHLVFPAARIEANRNVQLQFSVAYAQYSASYNDGLRVEISTDCGQTFQPTSYAKTGSQLATVPPSTNAFAPTSSAQWRRETVDLTAQLASAPNPADVVVRFVSTNDYGQNGYIANVVVSNLVTSARATAGLSQFEAYPVPFGAQLSVTLRAAQASPATLLLTDALGREVRRQPVQLSAQTQQVQLSTPETLAAGMYTLRLVLPDGRSQALQVLK